jgi:hypothetical protein
MATPEIPLRSRVRAFLAVRSPQLLNDLDQVERLAELGAQAGVTALNARLRELCGADLDAYQECSHCKKLSPTAAPFAACSKCLSCSYCSQRCQIDAWPKHKPVCKPRASLYVRGDVVERLKKLPRENDAEPKHDFLVQACRVVAVHMDDMVNGLYYTVDLGDTEAQVVRALAAVAARSRRAVLTPFPVRARPGGTYAGQGRRVGEEAGGQGASRHLPPARAERPGRWRGKRGGRAVIL